MTLREWWRGQKVRREISSATLVDQARVLELDCFTPEAKALLRATFRRAAFFGSTSASTRHVLVEAFERVPAIGECARALGLDLAVVRDAIAAPLGDEEPSTTMEQVAATKADRALWAVAVTAREQRRAGSAAMEPRGLVAHALTVDVALARDLESFGMSRRALVAWFAWSVLEHAFIDEDAFGGHDALDVWLDNDDFTPMDFVVDVLRDELELAPDDAQRCMREVHERGSSRVATFARLEAIARANAVLDEGRAAGHPLRIRVAPRGHPST